MGSPSQLNVEYLFRLLYNCIRGACTGGDSAALGAFLASLWVWVTVLGYLLSFLALGLIIYCIMQLFELRKREEAMYAPIHVVKEAGPTNPRWAHIDSLMASGSASDWRQAIIEADIMLADMLKRQGYLGDSIGDQLQQVDPADFDTLQDAWEAHKIRNEIAHSGSAFDLSQVLAQRTIGRYEKVFREFDLI